MSFNGLRKFRWLLLALAIVGVAAAVPSVIDLIREEWYLRRLASASALDQADAIRTLGAMGSRRAVRHLCAIIEDERHSWQDIGPIDFDADEFVFAEPDPNDDVDLPHEALKALRQIAPPPEAVLPSIYRSVEVGNHGVVLFGCGSGVSSSTADAECVVALSELAAGRPQLLSETVRSGSSDAALVAALAVGRLRPAAKEADRAVAALLVRAADDDEGLRNAVGWALGQFVPEAFPALLDTLAVHYNRTWAWSTAASAFGVAGRPAVPFLEASLTNDDPRKRMAAAVALAHIGKLAGGAAEALLLAIENDEDAEVRRLSARALHDVGVPGEVAVGVLVKLLRDRSSDMRRTVVAALARYGEAASAAVQPLVAILEQGTLQSEVVIALKNIGSLDEDAVGVLIELLAADKSGALFGRLAEALERAGPEAKNAVPILIRVLEDSRPTQNPWAAMDLLGAIGPEARKAVPVLIRWLQTDSQGSRIHAADALAAIGALEAIPALEKAAQHPDGMSHDSARQALRKLRGSESNRP